MPRSNTGQGLLQRQVVVLQAVHEGFEFLDGALELRRVGDGVVGFAVSLMGCGLALGEATVV
jgi:hypothetical protein